MKSPVLIHVAVKPGSKEASIAVHDGNIILRVKERALEGAANDGCIRALASKIGVARTAITLVRGARARVKTFAVTGIEAGDIQKRLEESG